MLTTRIITLAATGVLAVAAAAAVGTPADHEQAVSTGDANRPGVTSTSSAGGGSPAGPSDSPTSTGEGSGMAPTSQMSPSASSNPTAGGGSPATPTGPATTNGAISGSGPTSAVSPSASGNSTPRGGSSAAPMAPPTTNGGISGSGPTADVTPSPSSEPTASGEPPPQTAPPSPLLDDASPEPAFAEGALVASFPSALGPPAGTAVASSSVSVSSNVVQAALVGKGGDPQEIVVHYRELLTERGFTEQQLQGVDNEPVAAFTNGRDIVTVTTQDGTMYLVATLRLKDAQD
jgi:hypothetical protein